MLVKNRPAGYCKRFCITGAEARFMKISPRRQIRFFWQRHAMALCFLLPLSLAACWALAVEPGLLRECDRTVAVADLDPSLEGFTIAVVSDLHLNWRRKEKLAEYAACINRRRPDLIVLLGDMVNNPRRPTDPAPAELSQWLSTLRARHGICGVLGNHDVGFGTAWITEVLKAGGCRVLNNETFRIGPDRGGLNLIGIDYRNSSLDDSLGFCRRLLRKDCVNLLLFHTPDLFREQPREIALTLAGHTHGGQLALPFYGSLLGYSRYGRRYVYGHIREADGRQMIVTSGLGGTRDIRFCVPPEIVFVKLTNRPKSAK